MSSSLAYVIWNPSPIIAELGPVLLRWYGVLFALGFIISSPVITGIFRKEGVRPEWVDVLTLYMVVGTVLGARLGHVFFYDWDKYKDNLLDIFKIWEGGLASHGATIAIPLAVYLFSRRNKFDYLWVLDRIVITVAIGGACIRLGNLMNSEIGGKPTDVPWAFVFPRDTEHLRQFRPDQPVPAGSVAVQRIVVPGKKDAQYTVTPVSGLVAPDTLVAVPRHPTQIYESLFCVFLLLLTYGLWNKYRERTPRGMLLGLFMALLFSFRIGVEFLKENQVSQEGGIISQYHFNIGQLLSIPFILIGVWILLRAGKNPQNPYGYAPRDLAEASEKAAALPKSA